MNFVLNSYIPFFANLGVISILAWLISFNSKTLFSVKSKPSFNTRIITGVMFGVATSILMFLPMEFEPGLIGDARGAPLLISGIVGGPIAAFITILFGAVTRWYVGGIGMPVGICFVIIFGLVGIFINYFNREKISENLITLPKLIIFSLCATVLTLPLILLFPSEKQFSILTNLWPVLSLANISGVIILGSLIQYEYKRAINNALFLSGFESVTVGVILCDDRGTIYKFNHKAESIFGYKEIEVVGKNVKILMPNPDHVNHDRYLKNYLVTGDRKILGIGREVLGLKKNGDIFPLHLGIGETSSLGQRLFIGSVHDLTNRKQLEEQIRRSQKMEAVGKLTGGIAHDFNNILSIVMGNLEIAINASKENKVVKERLNVALSGVVRGAELTQKLLGFSGSTPHQAQKVSVNDVITELEDILQKSITISVTLTDDLAEDLWLTNLDAGDLQDAILNLVFNARDACNNGGQIVIKTENKVLDNHYTLLHPESKAGEYVMLSVIDTGIGMPPDILEKALDPFFTTKETDKGTGLGLSMVYGFVQRSGGFIDLVSQPGIGTTVSIFLPRSNHKVDSAPSREENHSIPGGTETILVVEDEIEMADIARHYLEELGYQVVICHTGREAMNVLQNEHSFDLLFTDVVMPDGVDGYDLSASAKKSSPNLRILLTSGFTRRDENSLDASDETQLKLTSHLLKKPYNKVDLATAIRHTLDQ